MPTGSPTSTAPSRPPRDQTPTHPNVYAVGIATAVNAPWQSANAVGVPRTGFPAETMARVAPQASGPVLRAEVEGVEFPDWGPEFGWRATGTRRDEIGDRDATTVFYEHEGHRLAYTIVSGPALPRPAGARTVERGRLQISVYRDPAHGGHGVAVFERGGRTCVIAGHVIELSTLLELAAWKGDGHVKS